MALSRFENHIGKPVEIDICWSCHLIWFDHLESASLSGESVIKLFREIHGHRDDARTTVASRVNCPTCRDTLTHAYDFSRGGRFSYHRCPQSHGRLITFVQFLREKQFVRTLSDHELTTLSAKVKQIRCSSCGAGINIEKDRACTHCGSPVSVLDENAVAKALANHSKKPPPPATDPANLPNVSYPSRGAPTPIEPESHEAGLTDLVLSGIALILSVTLD